MRQHIAEDKLRLEQLEKDREESEKVRVQLAADLRISQAEASHLRSAIANLEKQVETLSTSLHAQTDALSAVRSDAREKFDQLERERVEAERIRERLTAELRISEAESSILRSAVESLGRQIENLSAALKAETDAFVRIEKRNLDVISSLEADLSSLRNEHQSQVDQSGAEIARLRTREAELDAAAKRQSAQYERDQMVMEWLRAVHIAIAGRPFWWSLLPPRLRRRREYEVLRNVGLFDDAEYLARHPDVATKRTDPLQHYITYGIREGRDRGFGSGDNLSTSH